MTQDAGPRPAPLFAADAHKGSAGRVLVVAGSRTMPGAAILCVRAAQRGGAGLVKLVCLDASLANVVPATSPETVLSFAAPSELFARADEDALVCGPGLGMHKDEPWLQELANGAWSRPAVLDADALNAFAGAPERLAGCAGPLVITPHPGEAARLLGRDVPGDPEGRVSAARELAQRARAICCLKGAGTVVTDGERVYVNTTGNPGLATAGSGDVLAGLLGAYLAAGKSDETWSVFDAAAAAVHVHGLAGDLGAARAGQRGLVASDVVLWLGRADERFRAEFQAELAPGGSRARRERGERAS